MKPKTFIGAILFSALTFGVNAEGIGYETVADALEQLKQKQGTNVSIQGGWTIIEDSEGSNMVLWSFTPENHPAHPAAIKRKVVEKDKKIYIRMTALCQAKKADCDRLMSEFEQLNKQIMGN